MELFLKLLESYAKVIGNIFENADFLAEKAATFIEQKSDIPVQ